LPAVFLQHLANRSPTLCSKQYVKFAGEKYENIFLCQKTALENGIGERHWKTALENGIGKQYCNCVGKQRGKGVRKWHYKAMPKN
jgi:hypothetical protein